MSGLEDWANYVSDEAMTAVHEDIADRIDELTLMLDVINSSIVTGMGMPEKNSPCHKKILELMERNGRKATAGSNNDK